MQQNQTTKLALKLAGIYILVQAIHYIPLVINSLRSFNQFNGDPIGPISILGTFAILAILGLWLALKNKPELDSKTTGSTDLVTLGLSIAGVMIFALAISDLPLLISKLLSTFSRSGPLEITGGGDSTESVMNLTGNLIQLLLGALLFFKSKYFTKFIK